MIDGKRHPHDQSVYHTIRVSTSNRVIRLEELQPIQCLRLDSERTTDALHFNDHKR
jgi:hypothetical protein